MHESYEFTYCGNLAMDLRPAGFVAHAPQLGLRQTLTRALSRTALCPSFGYGPVLFCSSPRRCGFPTTLSGVFACAAAEDSSVSANLAVKMPKLYDAWFPPTNEIAVQMRAAVKAALGNNKYQMEVKFPVTPNLEEIDFGTKNNFLFGQHVSRVLGMDGPSEYPLIKRYLSEFCDLYWVTELAKAFPDRIVWAVFQGGISKEKAKLPVSNVRLASFRRGNEPTAKDGDVIVVVDPRMTDSWIAGAKLQPSATSPLIFLNSQFNETYGLVGPRRRMLKGVETVYFLKRLTRGYAFRSYPQPWQAVLELPDCSCEVLQTFGNDTPKLRDIASIVRTTSNDRYGAFNDRYAKGFGGRL